MFSVYDLQGSRCLFRWDSWNFQQRRNVCNCWWKLLFFIYGYWCKFVIVIVNVPTVFVFFLIVWWHIVTIAPKEITQQQNQSIYHTINSQIFVVCCTCLLHNYSHYKYLLLLIQKDEMNHLLVETSDPLLFTNKARAHGFYDSREISLPPPCISNRICPVHKGTVPKSQPNETQRILTQLVRIHQTCKADALKIFHFFSASAPSLTVPSATFPTARPHILQYVD